MCIILDRWLYKIMSDNLKYFYTTCYWNKNKRLHCLCLSKSAILVSQAKEYRQLKQPSIKWACTLWHTHTHTPMPLLAYLLFDSFEIELWLTQDMVWYHLNSAYSAYHRVTVKLSDPFANVYCGRRRMLWCGLKIEITQDGMGFVFRERFVETLKCVCVC